MKFRWEASSPYGGSAVHATPHDYDGHPGPNLLSLDFCPRFATAEVIAAASVLSFAPFIGSVVEIATAIRPEAASSIAEFLRPRQVSVRDIDYKPKAITYPSGTFWLRADDKPSDLPFQDVNGGRAIELRLVSSSQGFAFNHTDDRLTVPTNADVLTPGRPGDDSGRAWLPRLAVALLLAGDFDIGFVRLPPEVESTDLLRKAGEVMRSAGVGLQFA